MLYVNRDTQGNIIELSPEQNETTREAVMADDPGVVQFINERWRQNELAVLDREFVRVIEDLLELLIKKDVILFTDLPSMVQQKFSKRREIRQKGLFSDAYRDDDSDIIPL